jgi:hypothetical protein
MSYVDIPLWCPRPRRDSSEGPSGMYMYDKLVGLAPVLSLLSGQYPSSLALTTDLRHGCGCGWGIVPYSRVEYLRKRYPNSAVADCQS